MWMLGFWPVLCMQSNQYLLWCSIRSIALDKVLIFYFYMNTFVIVLIDSVYRRLCWWAPQHMFSWRNKKTISFRMLLLSVAVSAISEVRVQGCVSTLGSLLFTCASLCISLCRNSKLTYLFPDISFEHFHQMSWNDCLSIKPSPAESIYTLSLQTV